MKADVIAWAAGCLLLGACQALPPNEFSETTTHTVTELGAPNSLSAEEVANIHSGVRAFLADPDSAIFEGEPRAAKAIDGEMTVCGKVNARDNHGVYLGPGPYLAKVRNGAVVDTVMLSGPEAGVVGKMCANANVPI